MSYLQQFKAFSVNLVRKSQTFNSHYRSGQEPPTYKGKDHLNDMQINQSQFILFLHAVYREVYLK